MYLNELKRNLTHQLVSEQEVDKEKLYTMSVVIDGREFNGTAKSKKLAKMEAARVALESLYNAVYVPGRVVYSTLWTTDFNFSGFRRLESWISEYY